jgi:AraC-like DNA-binding protein
MDNKTTIEVSLGFNIDPSRPLLTFCKMLSNSQCAVAHHHPRGQVIYCDKGIMRVEIPGGTWTVGKLQAIWIPGEVLHQVYFPEQVNVNSIFIDPSVALELPAFSFAFNISDFCKSLILKIISFNNSFPLTAQQSRIERVFLDEFALAKPSATFLPSSSHPIINKITEELKKKISFNYPVSYYADLSCSSPRTLSRLFLKELGMSFSEWTIRYKLIKAMNLVAEGYQIKNIALDLGYESASSFIYAFKKHFNITPGNLYAKSKSHNK